MVKTTRYTAKRIPCDWNIIEIGFMDTETQPTPTHENGSKIEESSSDPPGEVTNGKDDVTKTLKTKRQTRSRSQTPQKSKEKTDDSKSKKAELKVITEKANNTDQSMNGHEAKNSDTSEIKDKKEQKEEKSKKDSTRKSKSSEAKDNKKEVNTEPSKNENNLNDDTKNKHNSDSEKTKGDVSPKRQTKKESSKQQISKDIQNLSTIETITVESENSSKSISVPKPEGEGVAVEMDPLILATDEPDPELQFDENSDMESGKGSPIQSRCKTRRSHTRNIPTPKTPKSTDSESEKNSVAPTPTPENLNDTNDSLNVGDISTRAEVGSDVTRLEYIAHNSTLVSEDSSFMNYSRDRSLGETLRSLSPRKTFRPINDSYRQRAFRNNQNKSDLNVSYSGQDSVDCISGTKRKRSATPEERKKFKSDSTGFVSYFSSPLTNLKTRFMTDASSSTPKLTSYKDSRDDIHEDLSYTEVVSEVSDKKNWCAIM